MLRMRLSFLLVLLLTVASCGDERVVLYVAPEQRPCTGVSEQLCFLVREDVNAEWQYFYDQIQGFEFEPGYTYKLLVHRSRVDNPAADQSALRWRLIRVLEKVPAAQP
jgi:hypothetical protein